MSLQFGYLTSKQREFWRLRYDGLSQSDVSRKMEISRQTVNKAFSVIDSKVTKALLEAAQLNRVEIARVDAEKGFLTGRSPTTGMEVLITFSDVNGVQMWYSGEGDCFKCDQHARCREKLLAEARVRKAQLPEGYENLPPSRIADILFASVLGG